MKNVICRLKMDNNYKFNQNVVFYDDCPTNIDVEFNSTHLMIEHIAKTFGAPCGIVYHDISWPCKKSKESFELKLKHYRRG